MKPFSQSCENNKKPILTILQKAFVHSQSVLEVGSGTGQHAVYFAEHLPHLHWQTSDLPENHVGICQWIESVNLPNLATPLALNAEIQPWNVQPVDAVFTANTLHIMSWEQVNLFFKGLPNILLDRAMVAIYGPFNYGGSFTSESNARFNDWLKDQAPYRAIRDFEAVNELAKSVNLSLIDDYDMPANNRMLVWQYTV
ncbi:MAG: DUF938 domain-containing protein [Cellvibrionaceae bacterium]